MTDQELTEMPTVDTIDAIDAAAARAAVVAEAVTVIDGALAQMMQRELVSSGEVADLLLDVRMLLTGVH
jgi:hypothetical protein